MARDSLLDPPATLNNEKVPTNLQTTGEDNHKISFLGGEVNFIYMTMTHAYVEYRRKQVDVELSAYFGLLAKVYVRMDDAGEFTNLNDEQKLASAVLATKQLLNAD